MLRFAERLKALRLEAGLSQDALAKEVGLTHTAIGLWEQKKRVPNLEAAAALAQYFKVSLGYLAGIEEY